MELSSSSSSSRVVLLAAALTGSALTALVWTFVERWQRDRKRRSVSGRSAQCCVVVGSQWGDEGKGKIVDVLAGGADIVARFNGGANAGHTLEVDDKKYAFHLLPCGILHENCLNVIGNGVVAHLPTLFEEVDQLGKDALDRLVVSDRAHVVLDSHKEIDGIIENEKSNEKNGALGTTKRGIGPCYASKANRNGVRFSDLLDGSFREKLANLRSFQRKHYPGASDDGADGADDDDSEDPEYEQIQKFAKVLVEKKCIRDTVGLIDSALKRGKKILAEGANAALLDLDFGTYPYVTSSSTTSGGVCSGLGVPPSKIDCLIGVVKAYTTRVGAGPFPTELDLRDDGPGQHLSEVGHEYGTTTGRKRRCGWLDAALLRYSHAVNGYDSVCLTKLDVLTGLDTIKIGISYSLPPHGHVAGLFPASLTDLANVDVEYVTLDGWQDDITKCTSFDDLPTQAQRYIRAIEFYSGLTVSWVGIGPGRSDIILMPGII